MIWGLDTFTLSTFGTPSSIGSAYRIDLKNGKFDEVKVDTSLDIVNSFIKEDWSYFTTLLADFKNTLEAGNISNSGMAIQKLRIKKRKIENLVWENIKDFDYDIATINYEVEDFFIQSYQEYEYGICPVTEEIEGKLNLNSIEPIFEKTFILDSDNVAILYYNLSYSEVENVQEKSILTTLGDSRFPTTLNSNIDYKQSSIQSTLLSPATEQLNGVISIKDEQIYRKNMIDFLKNNRPKLLKDGVGNYYCVMLKDVKEIPNNDTSRRLYAVSFAWYEVAETDTQSLSDNGLVYK